MSEQNHKSEDPIEKLFREKARDYDISYREEDWLRLEKRLDRLDREKALTKKWRWIAAASILLVALLGYFTYDNYTKINELNELISNDTETELQQDESTFEESEPTGTSDSDQNIAENRSTAEQESESGTSPIEEEENDSDPVLSDEEISPAATAFLISDKESKELLVSEILCPDCKLSNLAGFTEADMASLVLSTRPDNTNRSITSADREFASPVSANRSTFQDTKSGVAVGFTLAPDFSTVGSISNFSEPGYKLGVTVEYNLGSRFAISSGIIQSDVRYIARGQEYKPPQGYWSYGIVPDETFARCILLDIPINLKYDFLQLEKSRVYATAGISSYIMLNEDYQFNYNRDDSGLVQEWSDRTGTKHWFSNAGFSVGYEYDFHPNWSLRAEPFVKVPLKEVGWGNVNLYSVGSFISINYKW